MSDYIPHNITTEAGKELWRMFNQHYGSSVWGPIGDGIEKIEKELIDRSTIDVTRIEVIDKGGRVYVKYDKEVELSFQDNNTTLKIFVKDK